MSEKLELTLFHSIEHILSLHQQCPHKYGIQNTFIYMNDYVNYDVSCDKQIHLLKQVLHKIYQQLEALKIIHKILIKKKASIEEKMTIEKEAKYLYNHYKKYQIIYQDKKKKQLRN